MNALTSNFRPGKTYKYTGPDQDCLKNSQTVRCLKSSSEFAIAVDLGEHNSPTIIVTPQQLEAIPV